MQTKSSDYWDVLKEDLLLCKHAYQLSAWLLSPGLMLVAMAWITLLPACNVRSDPWPLVLLLSGVLSWGLFAHITMQYTYRVWRVDHPWDDIDRFRRESGWTAALYRW